LPRLLNRTLREKTEMTRIAKWFLVVGLLNVPALAVKLTAPDGQQNSEFGESISVSGNTLAVSTGATVVTRPGAVYVYEKGANKSWDDPVLVAELTPSDGASVFLDVAISGGTIVVGASYCGGVPEQGCAYVFVEGAQGWENAHETAQLISSDRIVNDFFGSAVAINVNTIVIGAAYAGNIVQQQAVGEAYEFTRPPGGWVNMTETAKLLPSNGQPNDHFGVSVAVNGVVAVVGAWPFTTEPPNRSGALYVFQETRGGWQTMTETAELTDSQALPNQLMGVSVRIQSGTIVAGAVAAERNTNGSAMVYQEPTGGWQSTTTPDAVLTPTTYDPDFGTSVAINLKLIVVGDQEAPGIYKKYSGAVFVFKKPSSGWVNATQSETLRPTGSAVGASVAASGNSVAFLGAPQTTVGQNQGQGAVFVQHVK
jgi:hypothetical protein